MTALLVFWYLYVLSYVLFLKVDQVIFRLLTVRDSVCFGEMTEKKSEIQLLIIISAYYFTLKAMPVNVASVIIHNVGMQALQFRLSLGSCQSHKIHRIVFISLRLTSLTIPPFHFFKQNS